MLVNLSEVDTLIFFFINRGIQNRLFDIIMPFITNKTYLLILPIVGWFLYKDFKKTSLAIIIGLASLALADWGADILKHLFEKPRPCSMFENVHLLAGCTNSYSMPSNHAVNSFAFVTPFFILFKNRTRYVFLTVAFLVSFSRVYVGVHYPSDIIAGALFGAGAALLLMALYNRAYEQFKVKPYSTVLFVFLLAISVFRIYYIQRGPLDLSPDEAHYWEWSRRLDWSYYSKGPMIAYLIYLGTTIFGNSVFGIRVMAVIFSSLSSVFLYKLGKNLYDEKVGLFSAILLQVIPLFATYGIIFTIDSPFIFFWILSLFMFHRATSNSQHLTRNLEPEIEKTNPPAPPLEKVDKGEVDSSLVTCRSLYWILLGLSIGFGLLTKYTMAFFYLCACLFLLLRERRLFFTKGPYIALLVSLLVFSPVILWNAGHHWVTLRHTAGQAHVAEGLIISLKSFFEFVGSQFGVITPILLIVMSVSLWNLRKQKEGGFLFYFCVPVVTFFLLKSIQAKVEANWALPGYVTGIIAFSVLFEKIYSEGKGKKIIVGIAVLLSMVVTAVAHYPSILNLSAKQDPTSRLRGWKELGSEVTKIYERMSGGGPVFIFSERYQVSSELAFYMKGHPITYCVNLNRRMNQYDLWPGFHEFLHSNAIFVTTGNVSVSRKIANAFEEIEKKLLTVNEKDKKIRDYSIFLCYDFKGMKKVKPGTY
jgi:4-amino-4-deoxy-L-arabinose transferase-like glycosyltransferase/membrane-associated phospholipid phosphatase